MKGFRLVVGDATTGGQLTSAYDGAGGDGEDTTGHSGVGVAFDWNRKKIVGIIHLSKLNKNNNVFLSL